MVLEGRTVQKGEGGQPKEKPPNKKGGSGRRMDREKQMHLGMELAAQPRPSGRTTLSGHR